MMRPTCDVPQAGKNQANMFTVNTLRQPVNEWRAAIAQKLGTALRPGTANHSLVRVMPADWAVRSNNVTRESNIPISARAGRIEGWPRNWAVSSRWASYKRGANMLLELFKGIINIGVPFNMIVLIVLFGCITGAITGIAKEIRKYGCHRQNIDFKRELVERGLDGDEIERIVSAPVTVDSPRREVAGVG